MEKNSLPRLLPKEIVSERREYKWSYIICASYPRPPSQFTPLTPTACLPFRDVEAVDFSAASTASASASASILQYKYQQLSHPQKWKRSIAPTSIHQTRDNVIHQRLMFCVFSNFSISMQICYLRCVYVRFNRNVKKRYFLFRVLNGAYPVKEKS